MRISEIRRDFKVRDLDLAVTGMILGSTLYLSKHRYVKLLHKTGIK
jgi:hypothetical protein